jgi:hypothetical protein
VSKKVFGFGGGVEDRKDPIATSGNNVYFTWWTDKSGDSKLMFKTTNDAGKKVWIKSISNPSGIANSSIWEQYLC